MGDAEAKIKIRLDGKEETKRDVSDVGEHVSGALGRVARGSERRELHEAIAGIGQKFGEGAGLATGFVSELITMGWQAAAVGGAIGAAALIFGLFAEASKEAKAAAKEHATEMAHLQSEFRHAADAAEKARRAVLDFGTGAHQTALDEAADALNLKNVQVASIRAQAEERENFIRQEVAQHAARTDLAGAALTQYINSLSKKRLADDAVLMQLRNDLSAEEKMREIAGANLQEMFARDGHAKLVAQKEANRKSAEEDARLIREREQMQADHNKRIGPLMESGYFSSADYERHLRLQREANAISSKLAQELANENDRRRDEQDKRDDASQRQMVERTIAVETTIATSVGSMVGQLVAGHQTILQDAGRLLGTLVSQLGHVFISLGIAANAGGVASTLVPILGGLLGGPGGFVAGSTLIGAGLALEGVGAAMGAVAGSLGGGGGSSAGASIGAGIGTLAGARGPQSQSGFGGGNSGGGQSVTYNVTYGGRGFIIGTAADVGRHIRSALLEATRLGPQPFPSISPRPV